jgi:hypothetical protein
MVRCGAGRGIGLGAWLGGIALAHAGGCGTFDDSTIISAAGSGPPPTQSAGGSGSIAGAFGKAGGGFDYPEGGTPESLCPPGGAPGSFDGGFGARDAGTANEGGGNPESTGGQAGEAGFGGAGGDADFGGADDGSAGSRASASGDCPHPDEPTVGRCAKEGTRCSYGDPKNLSCLKTWTCFNGLWSPSLPCRPEQQDACPKAEPEDASSCAVPVRCGYESRSCECRRCPSGLCWVCSECPGEPPIAGSACSSDPIECQYGDCLSEPNPVSMVCCHGRWTSRPPTCTLLL